jgi:hypothetical protein
VRPPALLGELVVGQASGDQGQDLPLPGGQDLQGPEPGRRLADDTLINDHTDEDEAPAWTNPDGRLACLSTGGLSISVAACRACCSTHHGPLGRRRPDLPVSRASRRARRGVP